MCDGNDRLLRTSEVQSLTGLSRTTVQALLATGALPSITVGRSRRIPSSALRQFIQARISDGVSGLVA